jgi:hypothetical protein
MEARKQSRIVLSELSAAVAIIICFAVVLGVGEISHIGKPEAARAHAALAVSSAPVIPVSLMPERLADAEPAAQPVAEPVAVEEPRGGPYVPITPAEANTTAETNPTATLSGVWAPDGGGCAVREFRQGLLPTIINADGAWAGETFCTFSNQRPTDAGWRVVATCSNGTAHWTNEVRLSVKNERLVWASRRGTQVYTRCSPDFLLAGNADTGRSR